MKGSSRIVQLGVGMIFVVVLLTLKLDSDDIIYTHAQRNVAAMFQFGDDFNKRDLEIRAERWIVVDAVNISNEEILEIEDVTNWRLLVFGQHIRFFADRRCRNCIFLNTNSGLNLNPKLMAALNLKMAAFTYAISRGAAWIYSTSDILNLENRLRGYHTTRTSNGILYAGELPFEPDRHFGIKDTSLDVHRKTYASYHLGEFLTPSIQTIWRPPQNCSQYDVDDVSCRLPGAIVPAAGFPCTDLTDSLVGLRSFWALGSLLGNTRSSSWTPWWQWLMSDLGETIGIYPISCNTIPNDVTHGKHICLAEMAEFKCKQGDHFIICALELAQYMLNRNVLIPSEVDALKSWLNVLMLFNITQSIRRKPTVTDPAQITHNFFYEPRANTSFHNWDNPFENICKKNTPKSGTSSADVIKDILLIIIFNDPAYYSNVVYLDYIYRKYFTHIIYCGTIKNRYEKMYIQYKRPISFLEVNEINQGVFGYMCSAHAMQIGYKVSGYLQISDDVLLNAWTISVLPRDRPWFQNSIRKGSLESDKVPNITPTDGQRYWWPWSFPVWGVASLRRIWAYMRTLKARPQRRIVERFMSQLEKSFVTLRGGFYEASDIFYVPAKYIDGFIFFSNISLLHHLYLEIAIPTMLCGLGDISDIVRLNGTYLWHQERMLYKQVYNLDHQFLHPWKFNNLIKTKKGKRFYCTHYLNVAEM